MKKFPGTNTVTLNEESMHEVIKQHLGELLGGDVRIKRTQLKGYPQCLEIEFTTDPDPAAEPIPEAPSIRFLDRQLPRPTPSNIADDDTPF